MTSINIYRTVALVAAFSISITAHSAPKKWVGSWATAPERAGVIGAPPAIQNEDQSLLGKTLRQVVNTSVGGNRVRVRLSNETGSAPLTISAARIALQASEADIVPGTDTALEFGGASSVTIQTGESVWSDPASLSVANLSRVAVSIYIGPGATDPASPVTFNQYGLQTTYTTTGNATSSTLFPRDEDAQESVYWLTGIDVYAKKGTQVIAFLGDSLTDGFDGVRVPKNPYPWELALRLASRPGASAKSNKQFGLLNLGISGNQVTASTLSMGAQQRFDLDVLSQSGVTHLFLWEGINDIGVPSAFAPLVPPGLLPDIPAQAIIDGLADIATRARVAGLKVIGGTLTPFAGFDATLLGLGPYFTDPGEAKRLAVNEWIRSSDVFDTIIDFDAAVTNGAEPAFILSEFASDGLHFNAAGYTAIGAAIPLKLLTTRRTLKKK